jgi:hypothetical protein
MPRLHAQDGQVEIVLDREAEESRDFWYVRPIPSFARALAESCVISSPANSIVPELGGKSPEMTLKSVVLPAPFGPRIARLSPYATSRSTSRTA